MVLSDALARDSRNCVNKVIDRDRFVGPYVSRFGYGSTAPLDMGYFSPGKYTPARMRYILIY